MGWDGCGQKTECNIRSECDSINCELYSNIFL